MVSPFASNFEGFRSSKLILRCSFVESNDVVNIKTEWKEPPLQSEQMMKTMYWAAALYECVYKINPQNTAFSLWLLLLFSRTGVKNFLLLFWLYKIFIALLFSPKERKSVKETVEGSFFVGKRKEICIFPLFLFLQSYFLALFMRVLTKSSQRKKFNQWKAKNFSLVPGNSNSQNCKVDRMNERTRLQMSSYWTIKW